MTDGSAAAVPAGRLVYGVNVARADGVGVIEAAVTAELAGFDVVTAADHWGGHDPFLVLAAVAAVTHRVRLRSYVVDIGFWHPDLLARAVSTLDVLSGGRVDLGLGAGHMRHEHEALGLPFPPHRERVAALEAVIGQVRRRLADPGHAPQALQHPVPVLVGAMSPGGLDVAARQADVVALSGLLQLPGAPAGTFTLATAAQTDERVARVRSVAAEAAAAAGGTGGRPVALDALLQQVVLDRPPAQAAAEFAAGTGGRIGVELLLDSPFVLFAASPEEGAAELHRRADRWGITSWCTHWPSGTALAAVLAADRA